jgi:hypothetical protein
MERARLLAMTAILLANVGLHPNADGHKLMTPIVSADIEAS